MHISVTKWCIVGYLSNALWDLRDGSIRMKPPLHDDVIKWKHFPRYWPFVRGIHGSPVNSPHKGQWRGALMFSLMCLNKRLSKQWWDWWFETPPSPLWRHCNDNITTTKQSITNPSAYFTGYAVYGHGFQGVDSIQILTCQLSNVYWYWIKSSHVMGIFQIIYSLYNKHHHE